VMKYFARPKKENYWLNFFPWVYMISLMIMITPRRPSHGGTTAVAHFREILVIGLISYLDQNLLKNAVRNILLIKRLDISLGVLPNLEHLIMSPLESY